MWSNGSFKSLNKKPIYKKPDVNISTEQPFVPGILIYLHIIRTNLKECLSLKGNI